jgi:hypothetical protein
MLDLARELPLGTGSDGDSPTEPDVPNAIVLVYGRSYIAARSQLRHDRNVI